MSDHQTSYNLNSALGHLYLKNKAFQALGHQDQQSIAIDLINIFRQSDVNIGEILSDECFRFDQESNERRTIATIFKICAYCGQMKEDIRDYDEGYGKQGLCSDCAKEFSCPSA